MSTKKKTPVKANKDVVSESPVLHNRHEILFVYTVTDANPNGDPLNANAPRQDPETGRILASDVRLKRSIRDELQRDNERILIDCAPQTMQERIDQIRDEEKISGDDKDSILQAVKSCIDARLFGATVAVKKASFSLQGPVQFKWARSLHAAAPIFVQGTAAFARDGMEQRSFRGEYIVPFAVMAAYGIVDEHNAKKTGMTENDFSKFMEAVWNSVKNMTSRSKFGHEPILLLDIEYNDRFNGYIGSLDHKVTLLKGNGDKLNRDEEIALRDLDDDVKLDLSPLTRYLAEFCGIIEDIKHVSVMGDWSKIRGEEAFSAQFDKTKYNAFQYS